MSATGTRGRIDVVRTPALDRRREKATEVGAVPRIIITHDIREVDRWLAGKDERAAAMPGATGVTDLVALDGSNKAAVSFDTEDVGPGASNAGPLPHTPIPAAEKGMGGEQKPEKVSLSVD